jgi:hypothetical protein
MQLALQDIGQLTDIGFSGADAAFSRGHGAVPATSD